MALGSRTEQPSTDTEPCSVIQLKLEGSTILEAWNGNPTTRAMEQLANSHERGADPSRSSFRALPVYHGTDALRRSSTQDTEVAVRHGLLYGSVTENQVAPCRRQLPVLWTGFSPLRYFFWAAFKSEVLHPVPSTTIGNKLKMPWKCGDHEHVGVLVFRFQPALPSAPGEASYIIPPGREQDWTYLSRIPEGVTPDALWRLFAPIHHNVQPTWPETLHCQEYGVQRLMLSPYIKQFWRTGWFDAGITTLRASHQATYSISFTQTIQEAPPADKDTKTKQHRTSTW
ncbi:hypothetical protein B0H67DRAFT_215 [Lasiosphaeris hirsuta]|uniref:Uncharacterized protein n=1 Tax=Lasiosphaeris hirsuta TaxID=260670 RepID=A0AA40B895_9PEZI|nr:hypothetical protein B0H67DRAFT_215 [Lasiosphaeris hirsuta]